MAWKSLLVLLAHGVMADLDLSSLKNVGPFDAAAGDSCLAAASVASSCLAKPGFTQLPVASQASCICCVGSGNMATEFKSCASYIKTAEPTATELYSDQVALASICDQASPLCGGGGGGATTTANRDTSTGSSPASRTASITAEPTACASVDAIISSCVKAVPSFLSLPAGEQASCACYDSVGGSFITSFDKYAASCASYFKTVDPEEYSAIQSFTTFCARRTPSSDGKSSVDTGFFSPSTPTPTSTPSGGTLPTAARTPSSSSSTAQAGQLVAASGPTAWAANFLTFLLSFFVLM